MKYFRFLRSLIVVLSVTLLFVSYLAAQRDDKMVRSKNPIANRYIVVLDGSAAAPDGVSPSLQKGDDVQQVAASLASAFRAKVGRTFQYALKGFSVEMSAKRAEELSRDPRVKYVEEDFVIKAEDTQTSAPWGLDRVDQRVGKNTTYVYDSTGAGVHAYVIDSGIRASHSEFGGRVVFGADYVNDGRNGADCAGHGTHVAGILGGSTYGVAKSVTIHNLRVLGCDGRGTGSAIIGAVDWVTANHIAPSVANVSIGMDAISITLENAITASIASGVHFALAAGNENVDACGHSPGGRVPTAITVAATDEFDERSVFGDGDASNYGPCVDIFAPGSNILSAWYTSDSALAVLYGTSMASPFVAGTIARFLQANPSVTPAQIKTALLNSATPGVVREIGTGSPNRLLFTNIDLNSPAPIYFPMDSVADQYPAEINIQGMTGPISSLPGAIQVDINELITVRSDSVSFVLVGPTGAALLLQGNAGYDSQPAAISYTISDSGTTRMSEDRLIAGTVYQPTRVLGFPNFPSPGPGTTYNDPGRSCCVGATFGSTFGGTDPNGVWKLYARHQGTNLSGLGGSIRSWQIRFTEPTPTPTPTPTPDPTPTPSPTPPPYATGVIFAGVDTWTKGNWRTGWGTPQWNMKYGNQAWSVYGGGSSWFNWIGYTRTGSEFQSWAASTSDQRALYSFLNAETRVAANNNSATQWEMGFDFSDGAEHRLAFYCLDWDNSGRRQTFDIFDGTTGEPLDSRSLSDFSGGVYVVWNVRGRFKVRVTNTAGPQTTAVISGLFIDPPGSLPVAPTATVRGRVIDASGRGMNLVRLIATLPDGSQRMYHTNSFGYYTLNALPAGNITITATRKGLHTVTENIQLSADLADHNMVLN